MSALPHPDDWGAPAPVPPVLAYAERALSGLEGLLDRVPFLSVDDSAAALIVLHQLQAAQAGLWLALIAHADRVGVAAADGCVAMEAWLRTKLLVEPGEAKRHVRLARQLDTDQMEAVHLELASGAISLTAAEVVAQALEGLPRRLEREKWRLAQQFLLYEAKQHHPRHLRLLARRLDEVINPEGADAREAELLAQAEAQAAREAWCRIRFDEETQTASGEFKTSLLTGRKLSRVLESLMNPARPDPIPLRDEHGTRIGAEQRRGQALTELVDRIPADSLPRTGGCDPVVVVTLTLETLTRGRSGIAGSGKASAGERAAMLDTGDRLDPGTARRLAAAHGVIPAVLGTRSEVLDLGRKARLASKKQRLALSVQQHGTCAAEGCETPAAWSEAQHLDQWQHGGRTDLSNLVLLCRRHHRMSDHPHYRTERPRPGVVRIIRRT